MRKAKSFLLACVLPLFIQTLALAQAAPGAEQVAFTFDFPGSTPDHYSLNVDSSGHAVYISGKPDSGASKESADSDSSNVSEAPERFEFTMSAPTKSRIFELAKRANYFKGDVDFGKGKLANTGTKTLSYRNGAQTSQATYNYSNKPPIQELTQLCQAISATLEYGLRLDDAHRFQKLALEDQLKRMEDAARAGQLAEIQAVAPALKRILDDPSVMNVSRARAERLLASAGGESSSK